MWCVVGAGLAALSVVVRCCLAPNRGCCADGVELVVVCCVRLVAVEVVGGVGGRQCKGVGRPLQRCVSRTGDTRCACTRRDVVGGGRWQCWVGGGVWSVAVVVVGRLVGWLVGWAWSRVVCAGRWVGYLRYLVWAGLFVAGWCWSWRVVGLWCDGCRQWMGLMLCGFVGV